MAKKVNLAAEAKNAVDDMEVEGELDAEEWEELLLEICPAEFLQAFKKAKSIGQRADLLAAANKYRLDVQKQVDFMEKFVAKLKQWFIQQLPEGDATGIAGKVARVQVKLKDRPAVVDWDKFYDHIRKNKAFELLNRAVNTKAVAERWEAGKEVPGVEKFYYKDVSVTKVK